MEIFIEAIVHPIEFIRWISTMKKKLFLLWLLVPVFYGTGALSAMWCLGATGIWQDLAFLCVILSLAAMITSFFSPFTMFFIGYDGRDDKYEAKIAAREAQKQLISHPH